MLTKQYREEHAELAALAKAFEALLNPTRLQTEAAEARRALSTLSGKLRLHLANEDTLLYPAAAAHSNDAVRQLATRYQREMGPLAQAFKDYSNKWLLPKDIATQAPQFIAESKQVLKALNERIRKENTEFYAALDRAA